MIVTVSGGGFGTVEFTPSTSRDLESLAETTIWAAASGQTVGQMRLSVKNVTTMLRVEVVRPARRVLIGWSFYCEKTGIPDSVW